MLDWFALKSPEEKIAAVHGAIGDAMALTKARHDFSLGRNVKIVAPHELPAKIGLGSAQGQARLLHDLASIELQAMELGIRSLFEYPEAPREFRRELAEVALSESRHLGFCLKGLEELGFKWGDWDVHTALWNTVDATDSLIDRVLIVHRYLEGAGLDAGESIMKRLVGVASKSVRRTVGVIVTEEIDHVLFGSRWFRKLCESERLDSEREFASRMVRISKLSPRREKIAHEVRLRAGFTSQEIAVLSRL